MFLCSLILKYSHLKTYRIVLGALAVILLAYLAFGPKPWDAGVASVPEGGKAVKAIHHGVTGLWYGAVINFVIVGVLLAIGKWLILPVNDSFEPETVGVGQRSRTVFGIAALVVVGIGIYFNGPRLDSSLWGDEETMMKRTVVGEYIRDEGGMGENMKFREAAWSDTFFRYPTPNNHVLASIIGKLSHQAFFKQGEDPDANYFSEVILRTPGFIAGLVGLVVTGWCLACFGFVRSGILVMFLLVLHPWFVRYGSDFRGYPYMFLFLPLALGFLVKGLRSGRWRDFILFGLFQFLLFYSYFGVIYVMVAMNGAAVLAILSGKGDWAARRVVLGRWFVGSTGSAIAAIQLVGPLLPQMRYYFSSPRRENDAVTWNWTADNLSNIVSGMPWYPWDVNNPLCEHTSAYSSVSTFLLFGVFAVALVLGVFRLIKESRLTAILVIPLLVPWFHFVIQATKGIGVLYQWYTVMVLPGLLMLIALGIEYIPSIMKSVRARNVAGGSIGGLVVICYALYSSPVRANYRDRSVEPTRESVALSRTVSNMFHPDFDDAINVGFGMTSRGYDPYGYRLKKDDPELFRKFMKRAKAEGEQFYVNFSLIGLTKSQYPKLMEIVEDPELFEAVEVLFGLDEPCTRHVYRLIHDDELPPL
ncbi:MAG: hypothetical protein ACI9MB_001631 [Verrucomicrobiales bacterium]